jgi:hypothetical protein
VRPPREDTLPWYRQFWPWLLISLPAAVVIASMVTIYIAVQTDDGLVKDDYYKQGLAIHKDAARTQTAEALGVTAMLQYDSAGPRLSVQLNDAAIGELNELVVVLFHPTRDNQDQRVTLPRTGPRRFEGAIALLGPANWRVSAEPPSGQWRIDGRLAIPLLTSAELR